MSIVFYKEVGFTNGQIAEYAKMPDGLPPWHLLLGSIIIRLGIVKGLLHRWSGHGIE